ncbi:hypothetical protein Dimus_027994 [Dionaea muscipula]
MPMAFSDHHSWFKSTVESIVLGTGSSKTKPSTVSSSSASSSASKILYTYTHALHGFSASLTPSELQALKRSPGFLYSTRDMPVEVDTTRSSKFIGLNAATGAWPASDYGKDLIIGVVDTGIWPESKSFSDDGFTEIPTRWRGRCEEGKRFNASMCNRKLIGARYFNKGLLSMNPPNLTIPFNSARDDDGHGTHTSSTAAGSYVADASYFGYAKGTAVGMAPRARLAMYKALWKQGATASDVIAAIDQAIIDGVDVLSLSLGIDVMYMYDDPVAIATFGAIQKGIFVATSAGNHGPYLGSLHNGTPWVTTVAAGTMDREFGGIIALGDHNHNHNHNRSTMIKGSTLYPGTKTTTLMQQRSPVIRLRYVSRCHDYEELRKKIEPRKPPSKSIVVCLDRNGTTLATQVYNLERAIAAKVAAVAAGVFISNNSDLTLVLQTSFPSVFLSRRRGGAALLNYIKTSSNPVASIRFGKTFLGAGPAAPSVASYSSRGPSVSCMNVLKPDIMAPGELILASWARDIRVTTTIDSGSLFNDFNLVSGTSMACPHVAGVAALIRGAHPEWSPAAIRSAMMTTSDPLNRSNETIKDMGNHQLPASPVAMGNGHINPNKALDPGLIYDAGLDDYVNLLCAMNYTIQQIKLFTKSHPFNCSSSSSSSTAASDLDLNYPSFIALLNANDSNSHAITVMEFWRTVTNVGGEGTTYTYNAQVTPLDLEGLEVTVEPMTLVFRSKYEKLRFKVSVKGPRLIKEMVVYGSLSWVDTRGKYVVRSPIVATNLSFT